MIDKKLNLSVGLLTNKSFVKETLEKKSTYQYSLSWNIIIYTSRADKKIILILEIRF